MTAPLAPRPEDVYDAATIAGFRSAGYWRDDSLSAAVDRLAAGAPDRVLLTDGYAALTTVQLRERAYRLAAALRRLGVQAGDRVQVADQVSDLRFQAARCLRPLVCLVPPVLRGSTRYLAVR